MINITQYLHYLGANTFETNDVLPISDKTLERLAQLKVSNFKPRSLWNPQDWSAIASGTLKGLWNDYVPSIFSVENDTTKQELEAIETALKANNTARFRFAFPNPYNPLDATDLKGCRKLLNSPSCKNERVKLLFQQAQAHLIRTASWLTRDSYAGLDDLVNPTLNNAFKAHFREQLVHLPKVITSSTASIQELLTSFINHEAFINSETERLRTELAKQQIAVPVLLEDLVQELLTLPEVQENNAILTAVSTLSGKPIKNGEQMSLAILALEKILDALATNGLAPEKLKQLKEESVALDVFKVHFSPLKEALDAYEGLGKLLGALHEMRDEMHSTGKSSADYFEKHPNTLTTIAVSLGVLLETEQVSSEFKELATYFITTVKGAILMRATAATELARLLHHSVEVDPSEIPGIHDDILGIPVPFGTEPPAAKRKRIGEMIKDMQGSAKKELEKFPYKRAEEFLFSACRDLRLIELMAEQGSKAAEKRIKDAKTFFDALSPAIFVSKAISGVTPEAKETEKLWKETLKFLKEEIPGIKRAEVISAEMKTLKTSIATDIKRSVEFLENICGSEEGMKLVIACADAKKPKKQHALGNMFFRGFGGAVTAGGRNESSYKRYREAQGYYDKAVKQALEYQQGFNERVEITVRDAEMYRHAAKKAGYFVQSSAAMARVEALLRDAHKYLPTKEEIGKGTQPNQEVWVKFVEALLGSINQAIEAEEAMVETLIAEHPLFQDMGRDNGHRVGALNDGAEAALAAQRERIFARYRGGALNPMMAAILREPRLRSDLVELAKPVVRRLEFNHNPNNLIDLYNWKARLLQSISKPGDASTIRDKALKARLDGVKPKGDFAFDEKKFEELDLYYGQPSFLQAGDQRRQRQPARDFFENYSFNEE